MKPPVSRAERLLIVDDEPANLKLLDRMLRSQGYVHLALVADPRQVIGQYRQARPDLILLDINMPHLDGFEVMRRLRELDDPLLPPIVILTAQSSKDFLLPSLASGARDFIAKPFDRNELLMRVRNLLDAQLAHRMLFDQAATLESLVRQRTEELSRTRLEVVQRLGMAAEYRDVETGSHILRMSHICERLALRLGWSESRAELLLHASPMHDIGKIGIPDRVLLEPGPLDAPQWELMQQHTVIGARLLGGDDSDLMCMARDIALSHHEKWDGSGYPERRAGEAIPAAARIAAVADVFDALTSARPYKKAWTVDAAVKYVTEQSGRHFEPAVVEAFAAELPQVMAIRERFGEPG